MSTTTLKDQSIASDARARQQPQTTLWRFFSLAMVAGTAVLMILYALTALQFRSQPFPGMFLTYTMTVNNGQATSDAIWPARVAGVRTGDQIIAINGRPLSADPEAYDTARQTYERILSGLEPGDRVTLGVLRRESVSTIDPAICGEAEDGIAGCSVSFELTRLPDLDFIAYFVLPYGAGVFTLLAAVGMLLLRGSGTNTALAITVATLTAIFMGGIFDIGTTDRLSAVWVLTTSWAGGAFMTLGLIFPTRLRIVRRYAMLKYAPIFLSSVVGVYLVYRYFFPESPWDNQAGQLTTLFAIFGLAIMWLLTFIAQRRRAVDTITRDQANTLLIGATIMIVPSALWLLNRLLLVNMEMGLPLQFEALLPLLVFPIAAMTYAVLQYQRFDTDVFISQAITYSLLVGALVVGYFLLVLGVSLVAQEFVGIDNPIVNLFVLFGVVALFVPVRTRLQERVDALYFRTRRDLQQQVEIFGQKLSALSDYNTVVAEFRHVLDTTINPTSVFLFIAEQPEKEFVTQSEMGDQTGIRFEADTGIAQVLEKDNQPIVLLPEQAWPADIWPDRARLTILRARILAALPGTNRLNGFVVVGPPRSGKLTYSFEETRFIGSMAAQLALATERALVIQSLERRVRELDVLSQVGQAVNFTIEFDDLLELIYTQASRLIDAPCFYIALYDSKMGMMTFAFFVEENERYPNREELQWPLGADPLSEVVRTGRPLRLTDYSDLVHSQGSKRPESKQLKAWMGVPMSAGESRLGVIAAARTQAGDVFSDEQFKIFSNIGELAAASLEKARLFQESRLRERQLTVLNDISRQIVATESDVEQLLQIITASAVEILNADAGALFLNTDDSRNELEFRVVIGGAGEDLIGQRIAIGRGIVGEVATSGKALIVNDAANDPRHATVEVASRYSASSLLAVPLIAKDRVIGVLEVMNKRDGSVFAESDVDLLTTFGGQAAIAIENARLFQMTDLQLAQRVRELETLERIDSELNRTLDLREVASITVRSAMQTLGAEAGALGIVHESPPTLEIVAIQGYSPQEYPEDADGMLWPLYDGVVGRVMRSRQPDLISDVNIDPDYDRGLTGSKSQITLPMLTEGDVTAILILESNSKNFGLTDWLFAQRVADHASIAIANAQLYAALNAANKSKSEFMGFAAHELKNPLTPIKGYSDLMMKGALGDLNDQQRSFLNIINSNAQRMQTIIDDLRASAQLDANEFSVVLAPISIHKTLENAIQPFSHMLAEKNQTISNNTHEELPPIMGDQTRLVQVFTNLLSNAHKYSPPDTTIHITAEVIERYVDQRGQSRGRMMKIILRDEGYGMSDEDLSRLFKERYFRSENPLTKDQPGTGLGMMLTQGIIRKHNGEIWVESTLGEGSTFTIVLPVASAREQAQHNRAN